MKTYIVWGIPIEVDNVSINSDGEIENWDLYIGGVELILGADFLDPIVVKELEEMILKGYGND